MGRIQRVVVDVDSSLEAPVKSGVLQGMILGPLMFSLHINDTHEGTSSSVNLFADDCLVYIHIHNATDSSELQNDLDHMCDWAHKWQISFNQDKCSVLTITQRRTPLKSFYTVPWKTLKHYDYLTYQGVELSKDMDWGHHIKATTSKVQRTLNILRRNLSGCGRETKGKAYVALAHPFLE